MEVRVKAQLIAIDGNLGKEQNSGQNGGKKPVKWIIRPERMYVDRKRVEPRILEWVPFRYPKIQLVFPRLKLDPEVIFSNQIHYQRPNLVDTSDLRIGDTILVIGSLDSFSTATNPGQFDYQRYQRYSGFMGQMEEADVYWVSRPRFHLLRWLDQGKGRVEGYFQSYVNPDHAPLLISLLTGETDHLPEEELAMVRDLGLSHLLAISGLHLGLVVGVLQRLLRWVRIPKRVQPWLMVSGIWLAVLFVGGRPSAMRVGIYLTLTQLGQRIQGSLHRINLLAITALIILLLNPMTLFLLSFQLSFLVYLSILLFYDPIHQLVSQVLPNSMFLRPVGESLALSLTAFVGSTPVILYHFFQVSLHGIWMNLWAVPLVSLILMLGLATLGIGVILPWLRFNLILNRVLDWLVSIFLAMVSYFHPLTTDPWSPGRPLFLWIMGFYLLAGVVWWLYQRKELPNRWFNQEKKMTFYYLFIGIAILGISSFLPFRQATLEWLILDVGQGDGMFLQLPNQMTMLIDGGGKAGSKNYTGEKIVKPFLQSRGIKQIDLVCITHFDVDHVQGLIPILEEFQVGRIWMPAGNHGTYAQQVKRIAAKKRIPISSPTRGEVYQLGAVRLEVLNPVLDRMYENENDRSLIVRMTYQQRRVLLTGDAGVKEEKELLEEKRAVTAEFLKIGHHGSKHSTSASFLEQVAPQLVFISVGVNRYGHPSPEVIQRLSTNNCTILRTDQSGAIQVLMRDQKVWIDKFQQK